MAKRRHRSKSERERDLGVGPTPTEPRGNELVSVRREIATAAECDPWGIRRFPPEEPGEWVALSEAARRHWLRLASRRLLDPTYTFPETFFATNRTIVLEGARIDSRAAFFCELGEAVNGPGGYFGWSHFSLWDALIGGFGLEWPFKVVLKHADMAREGLGVEAYRDYLRVECHASVFGASLMYGDGWVADQYRMLERSPKTYFDEVINLLGRGNVRFEND